MSVSLNVITLWVCTFTKTCDFLRYDTQTVLRAARVLINTVGPGRDLLFACQGLSNIDLSLCLQCAICFIGSSVMVGHNILY